MPTALGGIASTTRNIDQIW